MGSSVGKVLTTGLYGHNKTADKILDPAGIFSDVQKFNPEVANKKYFDVSTEAKSASDAYAPLLQSSQAQQAAASPYATDVLTQMGKAATGQGPSLAEAQLKAAQDRNLSQQMAAIQASRGGSAAANQRMMMQNMGGAGRDLAQQAAIARLQERDQFMNASNMANQNLRSDVTGKLNLDVMPKQAMQQWEMARVGGANAAQQQYMAAQQAQQGAIMGAVGSIGGMFFGGPAGGAAGGKLGSAIGSQGGGYSNAGGGSGPGGGMMYAAEGGYADKKDYKKGGPVKGPGTSKSDSIPAKLSNGEFVLKAEAVAHPGVRKALEKLNKDPKKHAPAFIEALKKATKK